MSDKMETLMRQIRPKEVLFKKVFEISCLSRGVLSDYFLGYVVNHYAEAPQDGSSQWMSVDGSQICRRVQV